MQRAARERSITLPPETAVDAEVELNIADGAYFLRARLTVGVPGIERDLAQAIVDDAHEACAYSRATRGNIEVTVNIVQAGPAVSPSKAWSNQGDC
jgi:organic hydroperoxide reductase OsmC/OhrA